MKKSCKVQAPAKVNLYLHVTGKRDDGYHELDSLIIFADIADDIEIKLTDKKKFNVKVEGEFASKIEGENIIEKGACEFFKKAKLKGGADIFLQKNLPVAAGIGGGSADVAAVLNALNEMFKKPLKEEELLDMGKGLGADVPVCIKGVSSYISGIGEVIEPAHLPNMFMLLVNPRIRIPTAEIFKNISGFSSPAKKKSKFSDIDELKDFLKNTKNDLLRSTASITKIVPEILFKLAGAENIIHFGMSGSGATCFALFETKEDAKLAKERMELFGDDWWMEVGEIKKAG